jgi:5-(carboxyamino)imidazole ribonucleotide synthase
VADVEVNAPYDDVDAARRFAEQVDVVTFEFENVPAETLAAIERVRPVHPSPFVLDTCRHRVREKQFLSGNGFPVAEFRVAHSADDLARAVTEIGDEGVLKSADFGYDGKGQVKITAGADLNQAWRTMGRSAGVLERFVRFEKEISVIVARTAAGQTRCFDAFENEHRNHILDVTTTPAAILPELGASAKQLATDIAAALGLVGLLCAEMFVEPGGRLLVNELAPRPHNSGHVTFDASATSQFEQQLRAVCGLPLGDPSLLSPAAAMANLLGDLWTDGEPHWDAALAADPRVKLHLYGKRDAKPGRKMGHLTATGATAAEARALVLGARARLSRE